MGLINLIVGVILAAALLGVAFGIMAGIATRIMDLFD